MSQRDEALKELEALGARARALRERLPADSPLQGVAFKIAGLIGQLEAEVNSAMKETKE